MFEVEIEDLNETFIRVNSNNRAVFDDLYSKFSFEVPGAKFMPSFKDGSWDGFIRMFHYRDRLLYKGLGKELVDMLKSSDYGKVRFKGFKKREDISEKFYDLVERIKSELPSDIDPYDFQIETALEALQKGRALILSPTSSGKSLLIYIMFRYIEEYEMEEGDKYLLIVPSITLVDQMADDFKIFGYKKKIHQIVGGSKKDDEEANIYVSTWQSLQKQTALWFKKFKGLTVDEVHGATAASLKSTVEKCTNAFFKTGLTGTITELITDEMMLRGLFGQIIVATTYKEMRERGIIPEVKIEMRRVRYSKRYETVCQSVKGDFQMESAFVQSNEGRDEVLLEIARENFDKNGIFLFKEIKHLKRIEALFRKNFNRPIVIINGGVAREVRADIRRQIDEQANLGNRGIILLATYGTMSTGVSIKNLDYGVYAASIKSKIKTLQSLGRLLRKSSTKLGAWLYDIWDDLTEWHKKEDNYGKKHAFERHRFYSEAEFDIIESIRIVE